MFKAKRTLIAVLAVALLVVALPLTAFAAEGDMNAICVKVPADWENPCVWAWSDDGQNAFAAWPGEQMEELADGWYYIYVPSFVTNVIINANEGGVQTADQKLEAGKTAWITVESAEAVTVSYEAGTTAAIPEYVETFVVHAKVPASWESVGLWAWSAPDGTNAFAAWPGLELTLGEDGWYTGKAPIFVNSVIVNGNAGAVQTADITIDPAEIWITVADDNTAEISYTDPDAAEIPNITVYALVPADWAAPCLWAWSAPDGTNAFTAWPGEAMTLGDDGWYSLSAPGWINSVIVNANEGGIQTGDQTVETGKDIWVVVTDSETVSVSYEKPADAPTPAEPTGLSTFAIVGICVAAVAVLAVIIIVARKKKA